MVYYDYTIPIFLTHCNRHCVPPGMIYQMILFTKEGTVQKKALEKAAKIALDGIKNIRNNI